MFKSALLLSALVAAASAAGSTFETSKLVINKLPAKNVTFDKEILKPSFNKSELAKLKVGLVNLTALKGAKDELVADKLNALTKDIDLFEHLSKEEALIVPKPNKTAIIAKLDAFKDAVAAQINATIHKKDPAPTPAPTSQPV